MTYSSGSQIDAADYNGFAGRVRTLLGSGSGTTGYGQQSLYDTIPNVSIGTTISSSHWKNLRTAILAIATHQGSSTTGLPAANILDVGDLISVTSINTVITSIETNKLNSASSDMTTNSSFYTDTRGATWSGTIDSQINLDFGSVSEARWFFNTGGRILVSTGHPNGTSAQDNSWRTMCSNMGTRVIASAQYTALTSSAQYLYSAFDSGGGNYSANDLYTQMWTSDSGRTVSIRTTFRDEHVNTFSDICSSGTYHRIGIRYMSGALSGLSRTLSFGTSSIDPSVNGSSGIVVSEPNSM